MYHRNTYFFSDTVTCSTSQQNNIRLYNTYTSAVEDGMVQVCYSGTWQSVCNSGWDCSEANAACKQLGYVGASRLMCNVTVANCEMMCMCCRVG